MSHAQQATFSLPYTQYTVSNGLPQMQVRAVYVDRQGLVWIGTQGGLAVFDGNTMHPLTNLGQAKEDYILSVTRGADAMYFSTLSSVYEYDGCRVTQLGKDRLGPETHVLFEDGRHYLWLFETHRNEILLYKNGEIKPIAEVYPALGNVNVFTAWGDPEWENCYIVGKNTWLYAFSPITGVLRIDSTSFSPDDQLATSNGRAADINSIVLMRRMRFGSDQDHVADLYRFGEDGVRHVATRDPGTGLLRPLTADAPLVYHGLYQGVIRLFVRRDSIYVPDALPAFKHVRSVTEAHNKVFLGSDDGFVVVHADGLEEVSFPACDYPWSVSGGPDNHLYLACYKEGIFRLDEQGQTYRHYEFPGLHTGHTKGNQVLSNYLTLPDATIWGSSSGFLTLPHEEESLRFVYTRHSVEAFAVDPIDHSILVGTKNVLRFSPALVERLDSLQLEHGLDGGGNINDLAVTTDRELWVAAPGGVESINLNDLTAQVFTRENETLPCLGAVAIEIDSSGNVWSGGTCGLMVRYAGDDRFSPVLPTIITQRVNQIHLLPDHRLLCASNNNLYLLAIDNREVSVLRSYNAKNGLHLHEPSENGTCLVNDRFVWLPGVAGLQRLDLARVPDSLPPVTLILQSVADKAVSFFSGTYDSLQVLGPAALLDVLLVDHSGRNWKFQYILDDGTPSPWQDAPELLVSGLRHGKNKLTLRAAWDPTESRTFTELPVVLHATLPVLARHQVQWVLGGLTFMLITLTSASFRAVRRKTREAEALRGKLQVNQLRTIQAYFSPHFFFNLLANIQGRILRQDTETSNAMIVRMARLFRQVLDAGKTDEDNIALIPLSKEIEIIKDLVYLNNRMLQTPVDFSVDIPDALREQDPGIPPMLIEPFVENAFKHAFTEKMTDKQIRLTVSEDQGCIVILIEDNGIGIGAASSSNISTSMGMRLARERMEILNEMKFDNTLDVRRREPQGTRVELRLKPILS